MAEPSIELTANAHAGIRARYPYDKWRNDKVIITFDEKNTFIRYSDVIMSARTSQITGVSIFCSTVCSGVDQRKHQRSASLAFVRGIHWWPVVSPHKLLVIQEAFPFPAVIMHVFAIHLPKSDQTRPFHYDDVKWAPSRATRQFVQQFVFRSTINKTTKICITNPLWGESAGDQ